MIRKIQSRDNDTVKQLEKLLSSSKERKAARQFVTEGARLTLDAMESGVPIAQFFFTPAALSRYGELVSRVTDYAGVTVELADHLAARIGDTKTPQGIFAVCPMLDNYNPLDTIRKDGAYLLLSSLQDPGNLGTILRTAEALGIDGAILDERCPDLYSPKVLRASMGGIFRLPVSITGDLPGEIHRLQQEGISVCAAALNQNAAFLGQDFSFPNGSAVVIGNEGNGLTSSIIECCDGAVAIPMAGGAESLNAAAAATILLWEMCRNNR